MRVVLGVGGGIAAYKAAEVVRLLQQAGHDVQVVMTAAACEFIQPLTFAALTGRKVITGLFAPGDSPDTLSSAVEHIGVAQENDVLLVAPATANLLAKFANGLADDFLSTLYLAFRGPVVLAPAMNTAMWDHPATQSNLQTLRERGCLFVDPEEGWLACGTTGGGRLADPIRIAERVDQLQVDTRDLMGQRILITAGPTQEPLDPVRFLSNRSSGKMGYALAEVALSRGAEVVLVSGPVALAAPSGVRVLRVRTTAEMREAVLRELECSTVIIKAAAVADYQLTRVPEQKMKKSASGITIQLEPTADILKEVGKKKGDRLLIGFAAETENLLAEAQRKLIQKNCDMVVGNLVNQPGTGFDFDSNEVQIVTNGRPTVHAGPAPKKQIARVILDQMVSLSQQLAR